MTVRTDHVSVPVQYNKEQVGIRKRGVDWYNERLLASLLITSDTTLDGDSVTSCS